MGQEHQRAAAAPRPRALPARRRAARARIARRVRHALPARAPRRRDHGRRALREPVGDLGRGGEPAARAEGAPHDAARRVGRTKTVARHSAATTAKPMRPSPGSENVSPSSGVPTRIVTAAIMLTKPTAAPGASGRTRAAPANDGANGIPAASPTTAAPATASANGVATVERSDSERSRDEARAHQHRPLDQATAGRPRDHTEEENRARLRSPPSPPTHRPRGAAASPSSCRGRPRARTMRRASRRVAAGGGRAPSPDSRWASHGRRRAVRAARSPHRRPRRSQPR